MGRDELLTLLRQRADILRRRHRVRSLAVFGSAARDTLAPGSDVDVLVEFDRAPGFDGYMDLKFYLEDLIGWPVDLVTRSGLRLELGARIEREAVHVL
jgi:predicted nucleotidyltransferase